MKTSLVDVSDRVRMQVYSQVKKRVWGCLGGSTIARHVQVMILVGDQVGDQVYRRIHRRSRKWRT